MYLSRFAVLPLFLFLGSELAQTPLLARLKSHKQQESSQDQFAIVASVPVSGGSVTHITLTQHGNHQYLYAEHVLQHTVSLIDVTDPAHPREVANMDLAATSGDAALLAATGEVVLLTSPTPSDAPVITGQTVSIVSMADPQHPQVVHQFKEVSAVKSDERRGLVYLANPEGVWILKRNWALDPDDEQRYAHEVLYNH